MNIGLVTIAALLLLLPGVGFIVGVNFADKNIREIVFRNTPAELGYVIVISVTVHLLFAWGAQYFTRLEEFNSAYLYVHYSSLNSSIAKNQPGNANEALNLLVRALQYYLVATIAGFVPGYLLGLFIRLPLHGWPERFAANFVKHRWLINLVRHSRRGVVYAYVLLKDPFAEAERIIAASDKGEATNATDQKLAKIDYRIVIHGTVQDSYFASDGTMLYIVFESYVAIWADGSGKVALRGLQDPSASNNRDGLATIPGPLVVEGKNILLTRFTWVAMRREVLAKAESLGALFPSE